VETDAGRRVRVCRDCKAKLDAPGLDFSYYERVKKRLEKERKQHNAQVLRSYRIKP
jgi:hypothetical protein